MSIPASLRTSILPSELELIASEQLVEILPLISMEKIALISGHFGPLRSPEHARVPLWMAVNLKLKKKCNIVPPDWLSVEFLQERLARETSSEKFCEMPFRFAEMAKILLDIASDDIEDPVKIRTLLKDLREVRQAKSRDGLTALDYSELSLPNLCSMEINEIRPFFVRSMGILSGIARPNNTQPTSMF